MILALFVPTSLYVYPVVLNLVKYTKLIAFAYSLYLFVQKRIQVDKFMGAMIIFSLVNLLSTALTTGNIYTWFSTLYPYFSICVLTQYLIRKNKNFYSKSMLWISISFIFLNFLTWTQGGMYVDKTSSYGTERIIYFLGTRNSVSYFVCVALVFIIARIEKKFTLTSVFGVSAILTTLIFVIQEKVSTAIMVIIVFFVGLILSGNKFNKFKIWQKCLIWIIIGLGFAITIFRVQDVFSWLIQDFLGETIDFNGRTFIWDSVLSQIKGINAIIGHGLGSEKVFYLHSSYTNFTHNQYLRIWYDTGIIGLASFLYLIYVAISNLFRRKSDERKSVLLYGIISILVGCVVENICDTVYFYALLAMSYYIVDPNEYIFQGDIINQKEIR